MNLQKQSMVENWASIGARGLSSDTAILYIHFFSLTKRSDIYKQTIQGQAKPFTTLYVIFSVSQDQLNAFRRSKKWSKRHALRPLWPPLRILLSPLISAPFAQTIVPSDRGGSLSSKPCLSLKNPFSCSGQRRRFWRRSWSITEPIRHLTNLLSREKRGRDTLMIDYLISCIRESSLRSLLQGRRRKKRPGGRVGYCSNQA